MEMQGNATEIDERNLLQLDALLSHGYGLSPQLVMRSKGLSIEAKALYGYLSSFAGAGDTAFPSTSRILEELDISKNRFYKIRKELVSWGFISIETTATSAGLRTVYTLPQNPIAIKTEIDEIANRRNEIKSSLVANLHNEDMVSHKRDSGSECLQQSAGNEPCRQSEANARGWSDYPATPEQIDLTATVLAADEGVSIDEIKKDFSENPSIGELQIALEAKGHDTMAIQPDLKNYATPEQRAQLDMLKDKGIIGENELMQLGKYPSQDKASEVLENHADAVKMLDSDEISNRAEAIRSHDGMDPDSHTKQVESWKEDLSAKVGNAFEASRDAKGQPNLNNFALQCNLRGIAVQFANDGELLFTDANQHHKQVRADNLDPKFSRNSEAFKGQKMSKPLKQKQEEIIKSTDQRNHEHSRAHDSQDHGDAHGSENKAR